MFTRVDEYIVINVQYIIRIVLTPPKEKTWDEVTEEVLHDYGEAWRRLADL
jgi:hypothetical protein